MKRGLLLLATVLLVAVGCGSSSEPDAPDLACQCLEDLRAGFYDTDEITELDESAQACLASGKPRNPILEVDCLPCDFGYDARNGEVLELAYFCSDVCPGYELVFIRYKGIDQDNCTQSGGKVRTDPAWGGYMGCVPE